MSAHHHQSQGRIRPSAWITSLLFVLSVSSPAHSALNDSQDDPENSNFIETEHLTKLNASSEAVGIDAQQWSCVADQKTGLTWEKRDPSSALHGFDSYIWYQPEQTNPGVQRTHPDLDLADNTCYGFNSEDPSSFCNTNAYIERVNQSNYCGYNDWRLPTVNELLTLVEPKRKENNLKPLIDTRFFPFHDPFFFWTSSVNDADVVITVFADDKVLENSERSDSGSVRLVRGTSD